MIPHQSVAPSPAVPQHAPVNGTATGHAAAPELTGSAAIYLQLLEDIGVSDGRQMPFPQVIGLTSCGRREGVSTIAANLAWVAARSQGLNVLLVDAHLAAPALGKFAGLTAAKGLTDFLSTQGELSECIHKGTCQGLSYLPVGQCDVADALLRKNLTALFESVRRDYDLIVIDLPPLSEQNNCASMAQGTDGVLLVVASERVRAEVAHQAMRVLQQAEVGLFGVVLNEAG